MAGPSKIGKAELVKLSREQSDVLAFADRNREIEELPPGLETGETKRRKRGARTDLDCINEICELIAQGITVMAAVRYVGVPYATWHKWVKLNHEQSREKFEFAYFAHLEAMADRTLQIYEDLKTQRETERMRRIGMLMNLAENDPETRARRAAFLQALQELGWSEGRNLRIVHVTRSPRRLRSQAYRSGFPLRPDDGGAHLER